MHQSTDATPSDASAGEATRIHLHGDDYPVTLALLAEVLKVRRHDPAGLANIGYEPSEYGVWVDWDRLDRRSWLSSTERAAVVVARGVAAAERQGGWPPRIRQALVDAVGSL